MRRNTREQDIREIPCHDWDTRHMTAKVCGGWTYFFAGQDSKPLNKSPISIESEVISNPHAPPERKTKRVLRDHEEKPRDWYTIQKQRQAEMRRYQSMCIRSSYTFAESNESLTKGNKEEDFQKDPKKRAHSRKLSSVF